MYSRIVDGQTLSFEHARFLYQGSFVMYDRQTISLWIHTTGESVIGQHKGKFLKFLPSTVTTWEKWRGEHPKTRVLNVKKGKNARFNLKKNPESGGLSVGQPEVGLKFYPFPAFGQRRLINDEVSGKKIVVVFDPKTFVFAAFERADLAFTWKDQKLVDQSGQLWDSLSGTSGKRSLKPVPVVPWLARRWKGFYPEGVIYPVED